jgi:hypothetical protein
VRHGDGRGGPTVRRLATGGEEDAELTHGGEAEGRFGGSRERGADGREDAEEVDRAGTPEQPGRSDGDTRRGPGEGRFEHHSGRRFGARERMGERSVEEAT